MRKKLIICFIAAGALICFGISSAMAGAKIKVSDDTEINLGWRLQTQVNFTENNVDGNPGLESDLDFVVRRARLRLGADIGKYFSTFLQTEASGNTTVGIDVVMIDAFVKVKLDPLFNIIVGENMAPVMRQNLTSSGALLAIDRPSIANRNLTWGARGKHNFTNTTTQGTSAGFIGASSNQAAVRDLGVTFFGIHDLGEQAHGKYYVGVYDGINGGGSLGSPGEDTERIAGRLQVNFFDPEPGYYHLATYLGKKKTIAIGAAFDTQSDVAESGGTNFDYEQFTIDGFVEYPLGDGTITFEGGYVTLDLDDFAQGSEGDGFYAQAAYLFNGVWQPWFLVETWEADAAGNVGDFVLYRIGLTYFVKGHNANVKAGYEILDADYNLDGTDDSVGSFVVGLYVTY